MATDDVRTGTRLGNPTRPRRGLAGLAAALVAGHVLLPQPVTAQPATFADFPLVIYCEYEGITHAYYFSQLSGGQAVYMTPDRQVGVITTTGEARRLGGDRSGSCQDMTLADLRAAGRTIDAPR
jgi:hypothetical protein